MSCRTFADDLEVARFRHLPIWERIEKLPVMIEGGLLPPMCGHCLHHVQPTDPWCPNCGRTNGGFLV